MNIQDLDIRVAQINNILSLVILCSISPFSIEKHLLIKNSLLKTLFQLLHCREHYFQTSFVSSVSSILLFFSFATYITDDVRSLGLHLLIYMKIFNYQSPIFNNLPQSLLQFSFHVRSLNLATSTLRTFGKRPLLPPL